MRLAAGSRPHWKVYWKQTLLLGLALASALLLLVATPCQRSPCPCKSSASLHLPRHGRSRHKVIAIRHNLLSTSLCDTSTSAELPAGASLILLL